MLHEPSLPRAFRDAPFLRAAAALAVGSATSAATTAVAADAAFLTLEAALPTFLLTTLWAHVMLRAKRDINGKRSLAPWLLAPLLAATNGAATATLLFLFDNGRDTVDAGTIAASIFGGTLAGTTIGAVFWVPGLVVVLAMFGVPLALARRTADRGVARRDVGAFVVAAAAAALAALVLCVPRTSATQRVPQILAGLAQPGVVRVVVVALAVGSLVLALGVGALGLARAAVRRRFLADVAGGLHPDLRIDAAENGRVLVRVGREGTYRAATRYEEVVLALDACRGMRA